MRTSLTVVLLVAILTAGGVQAQEGREVEIAAHDDPAACGGEGEAPCLVDVDDSWEATYADQEIEVTFVNEGERAYALTIVPGSERNPNGSTPTDEAFLETGPVEPGESVTTTATVPAGTDEAYLFEADHEAEGMHLVLEVYPAESRYEGGEPCPENGTEEPSDDASDPGPCEDRDDPDVDGIPLPAAAAFLSLLAGAALRRERRT